MTTVSDETNIHINLNTSPFINTVDCVEGALIYCRIECDNQYSPLKFTVNKWSQNDLTAYISLSTTKPNAKSC